MKIDTNVPLNDVQDGRTNLLGSARISVRDATSRQDFQRRLYGIHLKRRSVTDLIVVGAVVVHEKFLLLP